MHPRSRLTLSGTRLLLYSVGVLGLVHYRARVDKNPIKFIPGNRGALQLYQGVPALQGAPQASWGRPPSPSVLYCKTCTWTPRTTVRSSSAPSATPPDFCRLLEVCYATASFIPRPIPGRNSYLQCTMVIWTCYFHNSDSPVPRHRYTCLNTYLRVPNSSGGSAELAP